MSNNNFLYLSFLSSCIYGDAKAFYRLLNECDRSQLEKQGQYYHLTEWFYQYLYDILPEQKRVEYKEASLSRQLFMIRGCFELKRLYHSLAKQNLRFVPIKGADLAYRLYPKPCLRLFCDWDIWFHPDDCKRALLCLAEDGWESSIDYSNPHNAVKITEHHFAPHRKNGFTLEPHFSLARFNGVDPYELWDYTSDYPNGEGQRVLTPEMNILMLSRHASSQSYFHAQLPKLMTDIAMILQRETVNFTKLRSMSDRWGVPYPGNLLAAFPEFFSKGIISRFQADSDKVLEFRDLFEFRDKMVFPQRMALTLKRFEFQGGITRNLIKRFLKSKSSRIRVLYHLPNRGAWISVLWGEIRFVFSRCWHIIKALINQDNDLYCYVEKAERIESSFSKD